MKVVTVKLSPTSTEFTAAYFAPDVFSELDDKIEFEGPLLQKITADLLNAAGYVSPHSRVYVAKVFHNKNDEYEVLCLDADGVSVERKVIHLSFLAAANAKAKSNGYLQQFQLAVGETRDIPLCYDPSHNSHAFKLLQSSIDERVKRKVSSKQQQFENGGSIIPPKRPAPPQLPKPYTVANYSADEAERVFTNLAATNAYIRNELRRYAGYKDFVNAKKVAAETELEKIRERRDPLLTRFAEQELASLNTNLQSTLERIESIEGKIHETLDNAARDSAQDWADCANEQEQLFFSKQLLIWALYHAAGTYLETVQNDNVEKRNAGIVDLNRCFAGIVQVEQGVMTDIEEAYRNLSHLPLKQLQSFVNNLLKLCDTSKIGESRKLKIVKETLAKSASSHPSLFGAYEVEKRNFTWTSAVFDNKKRLDAKIDMATDRIITRFKDLIKGLRLPVTEELRRVEKQSFEDSANRDFINFQAKINEYAALSKLHARAELLNRYFSAKKESAEETLLRIQELLPQLEQASDYISRSETLIKRIRENAGRTAQFLAEMTEACERGKHLSKVNSQLSQELAELEILRNTIDSDKADLDTVLKDCQTIIRSRKQAEAEAQVQRLIQIRAEQEAIASTSEAQTATPAKEPPEPNGTRSSSQNDLLLLDRSSRNQQQPKGFLKRHFGKLLGGGIGVAAGAGIGALVGFFLAPVTFGLSVPLFAAIGAVVGGAVLAGGLGTGIGAIVDYHSNKKTIIQDPELGLPRDHQQNDAAHRRRSSSLGSTSTYSLHNSFAAAAVQPKPTKSDAAAKHSSEVDTNAALDTLVIDVDAVCAEIERFPTLSSSASNTFARPNGSRQLEAETKQAPPYPSAIY